MDNYPSYPQLVGDINTDSQVVTRAESDMPDRDDEYYFEVVVFKVENTIFQVPKHGFTIPGTVFEAMFSLPTVDEYMEGSSDQNPIILTIQKKTFKGFLRVMYPCNLQGHHNISNADWLDALDLSTMWMFDEIRSRAIRALAPWIVEQNSKEVVLLGKKYRILEWLRSGYIRILRQPSLTALYLSQPPSLDWETSAKLLSAKVGILLGRDVAVEVAMEHEFREEFSDIGDDYTGEA